jgi:hypothetical protein
MGEAPSWDFFAAMSVDALTLFTCYDASRARRQLLVALNSDVNWLIQQTKIQDFFTFFFSE